MQNKNEIDELASDFEKCRNSENETGRDEELLLF